MVATTSWVLGFMHIKFKTSSPKNYFFINHPYSQSSFKISKLHPEKER